MLYVCMTVAGSIPVLLCLVLWILQKQSYNFRQGKRLLLTGMVFYLVPFQMLKFVLPERVVDVISFPAEKAFQKFVAVRSVTAPDKSVWIPDWMAVILGVWLCCIIMFAVYQVVRYRIDIRKLLAQSERVTVRVNGKTVEVLQNKYLCTPYTVGFLKQSIIIPEGSQEHACFPMIYRHEERHRKNHDSFMKLICILIICVHWINPIAFLLLFLYTVTAEYVCDAYAVEGCTDDEKKQYLQVVIRLSAADEPLSMIWKSNLSGSEKLMRRRIDYMMKRKKTGKMRKGFAVVVSALTVLASASTILAYEPLWSTDESSIEFLNEGESGNFSSERNRGNLDFGNSNCIFVYEDGNQEDVTNEVSPNALCIHNMVSGYYNVHIPKDSGGCTVKEYKAKRCTKCGYTELGDLFSTTTYPVCPHK